MPEDLLNDKAAACWALKHPLKVKPHRAYRKIQMLKVASAAVVNVVAVAVAVGMFGCVMSVAHNPSRRSRQSLCVALPQARERHGQDAACTAEPAQTAGEGMPM